MVAKPVKSSPSPSSERHVTEVELLSSTDEDKTKQHSFRITSNDEESEAEHQQDRYAVEIVDSIESTIDTKHSIEMIARRREARTRIDYVVFGDDATTERNELKFSPDREDLDGRKGDTSTVESRYDEERDDVESGIGERRDAESQSTTRCDTDTRYTDTDGGSQFMNSLEDGEFSSDDDVRDFSFAHVADERTPRSLICDFDFQRDDFRIEMTQNSVDLIESGTIDEVLSEGQSETPSSEEVVAQEQEATSPQNHGVEKEERDFSFVRISDEQTPRSLVCDFGFQRDDDDVKENPSSVDLVESGSIEEVSEGDGVTPINENVEAKEQEKSSRVNHGSKNELDKMADGHEGLRYHAKESSTLPFSTNEEKLQQDATALSLLKPPGHILVEKQQWTSAVAETLRREKVALAKRGEFSVDVVHDVVSDLCFVVSPRMSVEIGGSEIPKIQVEASKTARTRRLEGLKDALSKRPLSPIYSRAPKPSTRKSDFKEAICDLIFVGDSSKRLERLQNTLLIETAVRGSEKTFKAHDFSQDRPFDEEESLSHNVTRVVEQHLEANGNSIVSNDLIDLSGNVSLVPVSRTLSLRHPVMAAAMMEDSTFPVCGAWQVGEVNELIKDVRALMDRKTSRNVKADNPSAVGAKGDSNIGTRKKQAWVGVRVSPSMKRAMKNSLGSPRRSYSMHKFSKNAASTDMGCSDSNDFTGETLMAETRESNANMGTEAPPSPSAKTDVSVPFDEADTTETFASRENNDEMMSREVEPPIIDNDIEDGASISLESDHGTRNIFQDAWVAKTCCDADGNNAEPQSSLKTDCDNGIRNDEKALNANPDESGIPHKSSSRFDMCRVGESLDGFVEWTLSCNRQRKHKTPQGDKADAEMGSYGVIDSRVENQAEMCVFPDETLLEAVKLALENEGDDGCDSNNKDLELHELPENTASPKTAEGLLSALYSMCSDANLGSKSQEATIDVLGALSLECPDDVHSFAEPDTGETNDCNVQMEASRSTEYKDIEKVAQADRVTLKSGQQNIGSGDAQTRDQEPRKDNSQLPPKKEVGALAETAQGTGTAKTDVEYTNVALTQYEAPNCGCAGWPPC